MGIVGDQRGRGRESLGEQQDLGPARAGRLVVENGLGRVRMARPGEQRGIRLPGRLADGQVFDPLEREDRLRRLAPGPRHAGREHEAQASPGSGDLGLQVFHRSVLASIRVRQGRSGSIRGQCSRGRGRLLESSPSAIRSIGSQSRPSASNSTSS